MSKNSFYKIYTADYSLEGYEQGVKAAKNREPNSKFCVFKIMKPLNYIWRFHDAFSSFSENYNHGYLDGQRVNNQIYQSKQGGNAMGQLDDYDNHLRMLNEVQSTLESLRRYLDAMEENYKKQIDTIGNQGFMQTYVVMLQTKHQQFATKISELKDLIQRHDVRIAEHEQIIYKLKHEGGNS